ncbi:MAG: DUF1826 domain-containing protein [Pseudomonadota bacterium]
MTTTLTTSAAIAPDASVFSKIRDPECNLAIWERETLANAAELLAGSPSDVRFSCSLEELADRLPFEMSNSGFSQDIAIDHFVSDVSHLANEYCSAMQLGGVEVRLEIVTTDSCRKWHADYVKARLITTYIGTGTQWLNEEDADRVRAGEEPQHINTMAAGDIGLFKGKMATDHPAIHRSPPIAGTGEKRLLLVLNPPEAN